MQRFDLGARNVTRPRGSRGNDAPPSSTELARAEAASWSRRSDSRQTRDGLSAMQDNIDYPGAAPRPGRTSDLPVRRVPVYVVAADEAQPGPPPIPVRYGRAPTAVLAEPVGIRHAVAEMLGTNGQCRALCGVSIKTLQLFPHLAFSPGHRAGCQRCAQLVLAAATSRTRPPILDLHPHQRPPADQRRLWAVRLKSPGPIQPG